MRGWIWLVVLGLLFVGLDYYVSSPMGDPPRPRVYGSTHGYLVFGVGLVFAGVAMAVLGRVRRRFQLRRDYMRASDEERDR